MNSPRRFVPTLTDVVRPDELRHATNAVPASAEPTASAWQPNAASKPLTSDAVVSQSGPASADASVEEMTALVNRVCDVVSQSLDDHMRTMVMHQVQAQQLLMIQSLRAQLLPLMQSMVEAAVQTELDQRTQKLD